MKQSWRSVLQEYFAATKFKNVDKPTFPSLMKKLEAKGCFSRTNAVRGFEATGIYPLNRNRVLSKITTSTVFNSSQENNAPGPSNTSNPSSATNTPSTSSIRSTRSATSTPQSTPNKPTTPKKSLELALLSILKSQHETTKPQKRTRVQRPFAESLTKLMLENE